MDGIEQNPGKGLNCWSMGIALALMLAGCGGPITLTQNRMLSFTCSFGKTFNVAIAGKGARVTVDGGSYDLKLRKSSIGRKYSSDTVTFIEDEDRAVLTGVGSGPFSDCRRDTSASSV